ncbi:MAG: hypothetical protein MUE85_02100 [Microscillaceae bacterium]|jgi:hypothetical protein|nr:hypothetical protein [Microscillaceae bacterium]
MKLLDYVLLALAVVFLVVGIDQTVKGIPLQFTYWIFMLSGASLIMLNLRKIQKKDLNSPPKAEGKPQKLPPKSPQIKKK